MIILNKTTFGYEIKATGNNKNAAKYVGMNEKRNIILTVAISGALTGLAASVFYLTDIEYWTFPSSVPSMGFDGISAAFLGGLSPIGTIFSSIFIKYIQIGGGNLDTSYYNAEIANMVTAIIIYLCAFVSFLKVILTKIISKIKAQKENKEAK